MNWRLRWRRTPVMILLLLIALGAMAADCGGVTPNFKPGSKQFYDMPFPNDLLIGESGTVELGDFPQPDGAVLINRYIKTARREVKGWGQGGVFFTFNGGIDPASLPQSTQSSVAADASAYIVSIDPGTPDYGVKYPVSFKFRAAATKYLPENSLAMLPVQGSGLRHGQTYAAVVTTKVKDEEGKALKTASDFQAALAGSASADVNSVFAKLAAFLDDQEIPFKSVAVASVYTIQDPLPRMLAMRDHAYNDYALTPIDANSLFDAEQTGDYQVIEGQVTLPNYQSGNAPFTFAGGNVEFDGNGKPIVQNEFSTRFALTIPKGEMPEDGWPILIYCHGSGGSYRSFVGSNDVSAWLARNGVAGIGIDAPHHGPRAPEGTNGDWWSFYFYNASNPDAFFDNNIQGATESMVLIRQVLNLVVPAGLVPQQEATTFDPDHVFFMGHSQGSTVGPPLVAVDPMIKAAYFSGAGAGLIWNLLTKKLPFDVTALVRVALGLSEEEAAEELDEFHPALSMLQHIAEIAEGGTFGRYYYSEPVPGASPKHVAQGQGVTDTYVDILNQGTFAAAAHLDQVGASLDPDSLSRIVWTGGMQLADSPVVANRAAYDDEPITATYSQYPAPTDGSDGHFVSFRFPELRRRIGCFFGTAVELGTPIWVDNNSNEFAPCLPEN
ncbi:MAG: hypothetical protein H6684_15070 [Deltaproteobacteria bacterium]|nr:hypothetical protein [bacterium]MCB9475878.1 hypothetical protein [Deltaproteobacteria bacterium]MCB9490053.1 hypothetical protein [Deltaproteobacteria bacterium]